MEAWRGQKRVDASLHVEGEQTPVCGWGREENHLLKRSSLNSEEIQMNCLRR